MSTAASNADGGDLAVAEAIGQRLAGAFCEEGSDLRAMTRLVASIAFAEIQKARGTFKPPATVDEAVDRAMAPLRESIQGDTTTSTGGMRCIRC